MEFGTSKNNMNFGEHNEGGDKDETAVETEETGTKMSTTGSSEVNEHLDNLGSRNVGALMHQDNLSDTDP